MATVGSKRSFSVMNLGHVLEPSHARRKTALEHSVDGRSRASSESNGFHSRRQSLSAFEVESAEYITNTSRLFDPEASLVLVGARGTGKSSLGVIAATSCQRRLIDTDFAFQQITGLSIAAYRRSNGPAEYHRKALEVLDSILESHWFRCVIVCGVISMSREAQDRLVLYSKTHPIVHIIRDVSSVQKYLKMELPRVLEMMTTTERIYRACSNLEFHNMDEVDHANEDSVTPDGTHTPRASPRHLTLKKVERCFLRFLALATNIKDSPAMERVFPLSQIPVEARTFTYAMHLSVAQVSSNSVDFETLEEGADAFELYIENDTPSLTKLTNTVSMIRKSTIIPIIYHVERPSNAMSSWSRDERSRYLKLVHHGLKLAPEFASINLVVPDEDITRIMKARGKTKLIAYCYSEDLEHFRWTHPHWVQVYQRAQTLGFDAIRVAWPATCHEDNYSMQGYRAAIRALPGPAIPLSAYNTGALGRTSCCFNTTLQPVTHSEMPLTITSSFTPKLTAADATKALFSSFIFDPLDFYIMGASSSYSLSPVMHNTAYKTYGMPHTYKVFQTKTLDHVKELCSDSKFGGCAISIPFKLEIMDLTSSISSHARAIGAINTVIALREPGADDAVAHDAAFFRARNRAGPVRALHGENTDWIGIRACVRRGLSPANIVSPKSAMLVVGAGGMSRAAIYAMLQLGVRNIVIYNRTKSNAEQVIRHFQQLLDDKEQGRSSPLTLAVGPDAPVRFHAIDSISDHWPEGFRQPTIIISCIPTHRIGDNPSPNFTLPEAWLQSPTGGICMEVAYRNIRTPLLEQIRAKEGQGWVTMDGLDLLPEQGFAQFELFTGRRAPRRLMRAEVLKGYRDEEGRSDPELIEQRLARISDFDP